MLDEDSLVVVTAAMEPSGVERFAYRALVTDGERVVTNWETCLGEGRSTTSIWIVARASKEPRGRP